jgi:hypothetical protein
MTDTPTTDTRAWVRFERLEDVPNGARFQAIKGELLRRVWVHPDDLADPDDVKAGA